VRSSGATSDYNGKDSNDENFHRIAGSAVSTSAAFAAPPTQAEVAAANRCAQGEMLRSCPQGPE
jgi:hypothetical protein